MISKLVFILIYVMYIQCLDVQCLDVYHESSKVTFHPDDPSDFFGYSVLLTPNEFIVSAPKANSRLQKTISSGKVFICAINNLQVLNNTCVPLGLNNDTRGRSFARTESTSDFMRNDMWFGANVALVPQSNLLICAPRFATPYNEENVLVNGACYVQSKRNKQLLLPLIEKKWQAFMTDGSRKEYGEYGTHLNYYAYGQAGFSVKVTEKNSIIIGAPGVLQWTGGVIEYLFYPASSAFYCSQSQIANPYFTKDLGPDNYFGYSVESGIFLKNGSTLYVAGAPRGKKGFGLVLIFEPAPENSPLSLKAKIRGPQLGSYFGGYLCSADINGDGVTDLLVGAPNFVRRDGGLPYDQGAVFVYLSNNQPENFTMIPAGYVIGSGESGSRFGSTIASLGDVDGDGYNDFAIGAPFENFGQGVVYIYKGSVKGLKAQFIQRISVENAVNFGISISKGLDIDKNNCNDLAVGAHKTQTAYIFRCVPTIKVEVSIKVPDAMNLEENVSNFTAIFCVKAAANKLWSFVKLDLRATIIIDPEQSRARISEDAEYNLTISPGNENCDERIVEVIPTADLTKPISMKFKILAMESLKDDATLFIRDAGRLSENSVLYTTFDIQLMRGCGEDLICKPLLQMSLEPLNKTYVPGSQDKLGVKVIVVNKEEPAFGVKVQIILPTSLKRQPLGCSLNGYNLTCAVPNPLNKENVVEWEILLEYSDEEENITIEAEMQGQFIKSEDRKKKVSIEITPKANFSISGKALPNATVIVTRNKINEGGNVTLVHYFEVLNFGPSDWLKLPGQIFISDKVNRSSHISGCTEKEEIKCEWMISARTSLPIVMPLCMDLNLFGQYMDNQLDYNVTTTLVIYHQNRNISAFISTRLIFEPPASLWPIIVGSISGLIILLIIVYALQKCGFFSRNRYKELKAAQETGSDKEGKSSQDTLQDPSSSPGECTQNLLEDSD